METVPLALAVVADCTADVVGKVAARKVVADKVVARKDAAGRVAARKDAVGRVADHWFVVANTVAACRVVAVESLFVVCTAVVHTVVERIGSATESSIVAVAHNSGSRFEAGTWRKRTTEDWWMEKEPAVCPSPHCYCKLVG